MASKAFLARVRRYAACITLALEYLHHQKAFRELDFKASHAFYLDVQVVFRDLKPDNVLITHKELFCCLKAIEEDDVAKLADFGLARSLALFLEEPTGAK